MKLILDKNFTIESDAYSFVLKREEIGEINKKTGKPSVSSNAWYYPTINMCLKQYLQESLKESQTAEFILHKLTKIELMIDNLNLPTLHQIKSTEDKDGTDIVYVTKVKMS